METKLSLDGCERCPVCHLAPLSRLEEGHVVAGILFPDAWVLECKAHGYMGRGETLELAVSHFNRFVRAQRRETAHEAALDPGPLTTSPCLYCKRDTPGTTRIEPARYTVECDICHMIKYEKKAA